MTQTRFTRILVPHDFSRHADRALRLAADLLPRGGTIALLHVVTPATQSVWYPAVGGGAWLLPKEIVADQQRRLVARAKRVLGALARRATCRADIGNPVELIVAEARRADLIVMATAGLTGIAHMLIGSVAEKVVRHAPVPVLIVPVRAGRRLGRGRSRPATRVLRRARVSRTLQA